MAIVDAHVHLYPPEVNRDPGAWAAAVGEAHWATLCTRRRKDGQPVQGFPAVDDLLRDMDAAGVDRAVLQGWYWERPETCTMQNQFYADCIAAHPDRLSAFATIHPAAGEPAVRRVVAWAQDAGFGGLGELSPHSQGRSVHDPVFCAALEEAGRRQLAVNLHVTDPQSKPYPGRVETPLADFIALARGLPAVKFILAHWGGGLAFDSENRTLRNVWYDTAASPLLYGAEVWAKAPPGRVLFGSDYPLVLYPQRTAVPEMSALIAEARQGGAGAGELGGNTAALLRL